MNIDWVLVGSLLVLPLVGYAVYLGIQLRRQENMQRELDRQVSEQRTNDDRDARQSVQIIARALLQKDLSDTEAAMRIAFLSQKIIATQGELESFKVFQQLAEATAYIPILEDWALLERSEQRRLTAEREKIEKDYSEFVTVGATSLSKLLLA
ncbi:MAG: DUF2489 domain-containing protein [Porticoccaceae bacterium]|nr:DUF2489 domain-containing protein [Porticoccaceae bacterium]